MTRTEYRLQRLAERKRKGDIRMQYRKRVRPSKIAWWWNLGQVPNHLDMAIAAFRYGQEGKE